MPCRNKAMYIAICATCGVLIGGCAGVVVLPKSGSEQDVLDAFSKANVQIMAVSPAMIGAGVSLTRPSWGPYYSPSHDAFIFILDKESAVGGYVFVDRRHLLQFIELWEDDNTFNVSPFATIAVKPDKLCGIDMLDDGVTLQVDRSLKVSPSRQAAAEIALDCDMSIREVLLSLAGIEKKILGLSWSMSSKDMVLNLNRPFWGPYYLASSDKHILILKDRGRVGGFVLVDDNSLYTVQAFGDIVYAAKRQIECYSRVYVSSGTAAGRGKTGTAEISASQRLFPLVSDLDGVLLKE